MALVGQARGIGACGARRASLPSQVLKCQYVRQTDLTSLKPLPRNSVVKAISEGYNWSFVTTIVLFSAIPNDDCTKIPPDRVKFC